MEQVLYLCTKSMEQLQAALLPEDERESDIHHNLPSLVSRFFPTLTLALVIVCYYSRPSRVPWPDMPWRVYYFAAIGEVSLVCMPLTFIAFLVNVDNDKEMISLHRCTYCGLIAFGSTSWSIFLALEWTMYHLENGWILLACNEVLLLTNVVLTFAYTLTSLRVKKWVYLGTICVVTSAALVLVVMSAIFQKRTPALLIVSVCLYCALALVWFLILKYQRKLIKARACHDPPTYTLSDGDEQQQEV